MAPLRQALALAAALLPLACGAGPPGGGGCPDEDGDGHEDAACGGDDCDDADASAHPGAADNLGVGEFDLGTLGFAERNGSESIAVDASGVVHVVHHDTAARELRHTSNRTGGWFTTPVLEEVEGARGTSIAVDAAGRLHVAYVQTFPEWTLWYATDSEGGWRTERVVSVESLHFPSLAVSAEGVIHVAYTVRDAADRFTVHVARRVEGAWTDETVDDGADCSVALDPDGVPHVAYVDYTFRSEEEEPIRYATRAADGWSQESLGGSGYSESARWLAIDSAGVAHVAYDSVDGLRYALREGSDWRIEAVAPQANRPVALALGPSDEPHIAYRLYVSEAYGGHDELHRAHWTGGGWTRTRVADSTEGDLRSMSFAVDVAGAAHVIYSPYSPDLWYATNRTMAVDGVDQNCDGVDGIDFDGDGHGSRVIGGDDCDDADPAIHEGCG